MTAATHDIRSPELLQEGTFRRTLPVAASAIIYAGTMVAKNASNVAVPASADTSLTVVGLALAQVDNRIALPGGSARNIEVKAGAFLFQNSSAGDAITSADIGNNCYVVDDNTVAKTDGGATRPVAGKVRGIPGEAHPTMIAVAIGMSA